jgi:thioredoxin-related protein
MKLKSIFTCFLIVVAFAFANAQESASAIMQKAYTQAGKENKKVFVMFHASWCGWCKKMDKNMTGEAAGKLFSDNYVVAHITVKESPKNKNLENAGGEDLLKKFKGEQAGLPFWVILDAKGNVLTDSFNAKSENLGCPGTPEEVTEFSAKLKKTSKLTDKQLAIIRETFIIKK